MAAPLAVRQALTKPDPEPAPSSPAQTLDPLIAMLARAADRGVKPRPADPDRGAGG